MGGNILTAPRQVGGDEACPAQNGGGVGIGTSQGAEKAVSRPGRLTRDVLSSNGHANPARTLPGALRAHRRSAPLIVTSAACSAASARLVLAAAWRRLLWFACPHASSPLVVGSDRVSITVLKGCRRRTQIRSARCATSGEPSRPVRSSVVRRSTPVPASERRRRAIDRHPSKGLAVSIGPPATVAEPQAHSWPDGRCREPARCSQHSNAR